jgi:hypothetical protein
MPGTDLDPYTAELHSGESKFVVLPGHGMAMLRRRMFTADGNCDSADSYNRLLRLLKTRLTARADSC